MDTLDPAHLALRRPCAAAVVRPQPAGHGFLKVPFARCGDGVARHVSSVASLADGPFRCLDCGEALTLRRPMGKRQHFAHRPDSQCAGETALHRYAKELLVASRTLTLPALVLAKEGIQEPVFTSGTYVFDEVVPEYNKLKVFQPDALVRLNGHALAVEFLVHHAVDAEKQTKVEGRDLSMVEIDLSRLRPGFMEAADLDTAILYTAPRSWIYHKKTAAARRRLETAVAAKRAERGTRLRGHILRARRGTRPKDWADEAMAAVRRTSLEALIGVKADCGHWFTVPDPVWQAEVLNAYVIAPSETYSPGGTNLEIKGNYADYRDLASPLPAWMIRTDLSEYSAARLAEAGFSSETYGSPRLAVWNYLATLSMIGGAIVWDREEQGFFIDADLQYLLHRRADLRRTVIGLLRSAKVENVDAAYLDWTDSVQSAGATPAQLVENGDEGYRDMIARLRRLQSMVSGYKPMVVEDLCGLPLEAIRQDKRDAIAAEEAKKAAALVKAAADRRGALRDQARDLLADEAEAWLMQRVADTGISRLDQAGESEDAYMRTRAILQREGDARQRRLASERAIERLRKRLTDAANSAFKTADLAALFLTSGQPRLGGARPIDYCRSEPDLTLLLSLMPRKR